MQKYFKIGELSRLYGIGVDSLRYYEKIGILQPRRSESGYRYYSLRDIWKLNLIRDLRALDFSMEQIRCCLEDHTVEGTMGLLQQEEQAIEKKIRVLRDLQSNVRQRMNSIETAGTMELDRFTVKHFGDRHCCRIPQGYSEEHEMDVLMQQLVNMDREHLYLVGSNQIGTVISSRELREQGKLRYSSVFVVDGQGTSTIPGGDYLSVSYRGDYAQTESWIRQALEYEKEKKITLLGDFLEILWIDVHTSSKVEEHITELQVRIQRP